MPIYSDLDQITPEEILREDVESVYQSIGNIISTPVGTRFFNPEFGSEIENLLFEPIDDITTARLYDALVEAIERWEPRVCVDYGATDVVPYVTDRKYEVTLVFHIVGIESQFDFRYTGTLLMSM